MRYNMKKKIIFILAICLLCIGCRKKDNLKETKKEPKKAQEKITEEVKYKDLNTTPIGILFDLFKFILSIFFK